MDGVTPTTLTCLDLTISIPGSSPVRDWNMKPLRLSKRPEPEDNWINIGYLNSSEETEDNDTDSPDAAHRRDGSDHIPPRKKLRLSSEQSRLLEESFRQNNTLNPKQKEDLGELLKLKPRQVEVWFQNRRARSKMKQTEMECEYLKRWFGSLTERNRKLQKEVEELRAMKVGPVNPLSAHNYEPTIVSSITMCPRCERVSSSSAHVERPMHGPTNGPTSTASVSDKEAVVQQCRQPSAAF